MEEKANKQFMILSAIGIVQVVICHLAIDLNLTGYIFPYTSFFIPMFVFISGYFYKIEKEKNLAKTIWNKFKKLVIPFFIINLIYGIITTILRNNEIINYGTEINLYTLFVQPFIGNDQFILNFPSWFIPTFFITYVIYLLIHKCATKLKLNNYFLLILLIFGNMISVYNSNIAGLEDLRTLILKVLFLLPFFHIGYLYKTTIQKYDEKVKTIIYIPVLIIINIILILTFKDLTYDMRDFSGFNPTNFYLPLITSSTGILFWLRISKILSEYIGKNKLVNYISNNTFSIMSHHIFYFFIFDLILYFINLKHQIPYFNEEMFKTGWIYIYRVPNWNILLEMLYLIIGVSGPLLGKYIFDKFRFYYSRKIQIIKKDKICKNNKNTC